MFRALLEPRNCGKARGKAVNLMEMRKGVDCHVGLEFWVLKTKHCALTSFLCIHHVRNTLNICSFFLSIFRRATNKRETGADSNINKLSGSLLERSSILQRLPIKLLLLILNNLDDVSKICLKCTSRYMYSVISVDIKKLSKCSEWLVMTRFEEDLPPSAKPRRSVCAFSKHKRNIEISMTRIHE